MSTCAQHAYSLRLAKTSNPAYGSLHNYLGKIVSAIFAIFHSVSINQYIIISPCLAYSYSLSGSNN